MSFPVEGDLRHRDERRDQFQEMRDETPAKWTRRTERRQQFSFTRHKRAAQTDVHGFDISC